MIKNNRNTCGFTIIELLVVIGVIGILATISIFSFTKYQANTRDTQRSAKATVIAEALEKYYDHNGEYPSCSSITQIATTINASVLPGIDTQSLLTPKSTVGDTNSIKCTDITTTTSDIFSYVGDGSATCNTGAGIGASCLQWTLQYREEGTGTIISIQSRRKVLIATLGVPTLSANSVGYTQIDLTWSAVSNVASYQLQRATDPAFTAGLASTSTNTLTSSATGLASGMTYYFRVAAVVSSGQGQWSNTVARATNGWTKISSSFFHTCAITVGKAYCWGQNDYGKLGNGSTVNSSSPVAVDTSGVLSGKTVTDIAAGQNSTCAIADGQAYCWGDNSNGKLGNSSTTGSLVPVAVSTSGVLTGKTVTAISVFIDACAIANGQAYCWGLNSLGTLGNGSTADSSVPVAVTNSGVLSGKTVTSIATGSMQSCAVAGGQAYCWGYGDVGLGNNSITNTAITVPVAVTNSGVLSGKTVTGIATGQDYSCVVAGGQAYCWGSNNSGQFGNNSTADSSVPVAVTNSGVLSGKTVTNIATDFSHTCVVASGQAYCWGDNPYGGLGNSSTTSSLLPVSVVTSGVLVGHTLSDITVGEYHSCALANGQIFCWGYGSGGTLGNGNTANFSVPVETPRQ